MLDRLSDKLTDIVKFISGKAHISEKNIQDAINEVKIALLEADVNLRVVRRFVNRTVEEVRGQSVLRNVSPGQQFVKILHDKMVDFLGDRHQDVNLKGPDTTSVILLTGLQGSGKTTTAAKLALHLKKKGRSPLLTACDLKRPAAVQQLELLGQKVGVPVFKEQQQTKAIDVVKRALQHASREQFDTLIVDTTGRLHIDEEMLHEVNEMKRVTKSEEVLLVADAMTGQNAVDIAKQFDEQVGLTGIILSKFDSDTRGGAAFSMKSITGKPIKFVGTGEALELLEPFYPDRIASRILGMGDVVTLVEKASKTIERDEAEELQKKIRKQTFTMEDYLEQFQRVRKMGSIENLIELIPGMKGNIKADSLPENEIKREEAIIFSMTKDERRNHRIINPSRKKRIAQGSGTTVFDVNMLIKRFEKAMLLMRKVSKDSKYQSQLLSQIGKK